MTNESLLLAAEANFELPDLCKVQPLLLLVLTAELLVLVMSLTDGRLLAFDWQNFANTSFVVLWHALLCAAVLCWSRKRIARFPRREGVLLAYGIILLVTLVVSLIIEWYVDRFIHQNASAITTLIIDWQRVCANLAIAAITGGMALRYLYLQQQLQLQQQARLQARIESLQARIRPHFLFNSMNCIASLIASDPSKAEAAVEDLSELFRASLNAADELVPLRDELELCQRYIAMEQLRMGDRLRVNWDVLDLRKEMKIPALSLQPLVENAIYHGIQPLAEGGRIDIFLKDRSANDVLRVELQVVNPLPVGMDEAAGIPVDELLDTPADSGPPEERRHRGNRIALANTLERLRAHFGPDANLQTGVVDDRYFAKMSYSVKN